MTVKGDQSDVPTSATSEQQQQQQQPEQQPEPAEEHTTAEAPAAPPTAGDSAPAPAPVPAPAAAPPLADAGFPDKKPVPVLATPRSPTTAAAGSPTGSSPVSPNHPVFTRDDEHRMTELTQREADPEEAQPLTPAEREELKELAARYQVFLDEGERALKEGRTPQQAAGEKHETLKKVVTGTSNALITAGKGAYFWGTLVATAVPGFLGKKMGVTKRFDHWNWLSNKLILGALPVVTSVGSSGNHLEQLKAQLDHRKLKLGLVVAAIEKEEMQGYGVGVLHFATEDRWRQHLGLENYEHVPMPDASAQVSYDAVKRAVDRMHTTMHDKGEVVYVHCKAGKGRSWMIVMCYLLTYGGMDWTTAKVTVESGRHQVHPGQSQQAFAQEFARRFNAEQHGEVAVTSATTGESTTLQE